MIELCLATAHDITNIVIYLWQHGNSHPLTATQCARRQSVIFCLIFHSAHTAITVYGNKPATRTVFECRATPVTYDIPLVSHCSMHHVWAYARPWPPFRGQPKDICIVHWIWAQNVPIMRVWKMRNKVSFRMMRGDRELRSQLCVYACVSASELETKIESVCCVVMVTSCCRCCHCQLNLLFSRLFFRSRFPPNAT